MTQATSRMQIDLSGSMTKDEEVGILREFAAAFADRQETYLADLFSEVMVSEFETRINNDAPTDVAQALRDTFDAQQNAEGELHEMKLAWEAADRRSEMWQATAEAKEQNYLGALAGAADLRADIHQLKVELDAEQDRNLTAAAIIRDRDNEIVRLKAKLYDLNELIADATGD